MKVLLATPLFEPVRGGVEKHVGRLARGLVARGCDVEVLTQDPGRDLPQVEEIDGFVVRRFPDVLRSQTYPFAPGLARHLRTRRDVDVVHAHSWHGSVLAASLLAARAPVVATPHYHGSGHTPGARLLHVAYDLPAARLLRRARRVLCVSEVEAAMLRVDMPHLGVDVAVVPNGIDAGHLEPCRSSRSVLVSGRLEPYKRVDHVVAALAHLPDDVRMTVTGEGASRRDLEVLAGERGVESRVDFVGFVTDEALHTLRSTHAVLVSLSRHEAFGMAVLEGACARMRVVASDIPSHREILRYDDAAAISLLAPTATPVQVGEAIAAAFDAGSPAPNHLAPTWDQLVDRCLALYEEVA